MDNFVLSNTMLTTLPFLSVKLHLADKVIPVWENSEREAPPFWAFAWPGGQALARYIVEHPDIVSGRRVLDLASGCGVVAIAAARSGAAKVIANEIDPLAVAAIRLNASANDAEIEIHEGDLLDSRPEGVILAGDVFYSREMSERILSFLERSPGIPVWVGDPSRAYAPKSGFVQVAEYDVPVNVDVESTNVKRTAILRACGACEEKRGGIA